MHVDLSLIEKYDISGPRYTSYPTALQFQDASDVDYRQTVAGLSDGPISLYAHIPFCNTLCYYCACSKVVTRDKSRADRYLEYLYREIDAHASLYAGREVQQLHWGGGTPTFLSDEQIKGLSNELRRQFSFAPDSKGEFSIEIDPRTVDPNRIENLRASGFNRLSMGVQDFNPRVQKAVNRIQPFEATSEVFAAARANGFQSVSVDLIYGLPFQTLATIDETISQVISLAPDRISLYNYAHLPKLFMPQKRINVVDLPVAAQKLEIFKLSIERLTREGYEYIGMDHFARPDDELAVAQRNGTLQRNFQGYSTFGGLDLVALGVTGISQLGSAYFQNAKEIPDYEALLDEGKIPIRKVIHIDNDDLIRRAVIMGLMSHFRLDFAQMNEAFDINFVDYFAGEIAGLQYMQEDGLLEVTEQGIDVSDVGRLLIRNICMAFDRHLQEVQGFSKVV